MSIQMREKAPSILTAEGARRITARIRDSLAVADDLLARAYEGRVWEALGHGSWAAWCAAELPELRHIKLRTDVRRERAAKLFAQGASEKDVALATGSSIGTAHNDAIALGHSKMSAPSPTAVPQLSGAARVRAALAEAGTKGVTSPELEKRLRLHHGIVSGELSRLAKRGLIPQPTITRDGHAVYVRA